MKVRSRRHERRVTKGTEGVIEFEVMCMLAQCALVLFHFQRSCVPGLESRRDASQISDAAAIRKRSDLASVSNCLEYIVVGRRKNEKV